MVPKKDFIEASYFVKDGNTTTVIPSCVPCGRDGGQCAIQKHSLRNRKTGPEYSLIVIFCKTHQSFFTLYPKGFFPYARAPLIPLDAIGKEQKVQTQDDSWKRTIFAAALDAALGDEAWPRAALGGPGWHTQVRQIERAGRWLGLSGDNREAVMLALGVELLVHRKAQIDFLNPDFRVRGRAIQCILTQMESEWGRHERLLKAGQREGVIGMAWMLHPARGLQPLEI
jgi:hypothetical protein